MILILISFYFGINNYVNELREYNSAVSLNRKNLEEQPSYSSLSGFGLKINKPPEALSTIITGVQNDVGRQATVTSGSYGDLEQSKYISNPIYAIFGELDLALIIKIVLSLFALLFTYDTIVGEKERGTLKLSLSNSIPRDRLILGKAIGGFISLMVPFIIPLLMGLIILALYPDVTLLKEDWIRIGLIFVLFLLYLSVYFTLGLFISSRTSSSSSSLFILLFIWVIFIFVTPKVAVIAAREINPIPSVHEVTAQKEAIYRDIYISIQRKADEWYIENPADSSKERQEKYRTFFEELMRYRDEQVNAKYAAIDEEYRAQSREQQQLVLNLSRFSPAATMIFGVMRLGKTGIEEHERFQSSINAYQPVFANWVNTKIFENLRFSASEKRVKPDISDMPQHDFKPESLHVSLAGALPDFLIMILMIIVFFTGAFVSFLRYDVR
jgi:ABC-type transport system involved in multi-copper enzyme maturation permease subunit